MNKYFYLPGYYAHSVFLHKLIQYKETHPNYFYKDRIIAGAYDLPYGLIWNGGRGSSEDYAIRPYNDKWVNSVMNDWYKVPNVILLHTCTNFFIDTKERLEDRNCNLFIQKYYRPQDKIIIANPTLKQYLKDTYPQVSFVNSTTLGITNIEEVNKLSENEIYVINYNKNDDNKYLEQLKYKDNLEILCGEHCVKNCSNRHNHYSDISKMQLGIMKEYDVERRCPFFEKFKGVPLRELIENSAHRVPNWRLEELSQMGYSHFKIAGRQWEPLDWLEVIVYYLVKPVYCPAVYRELGEWYQNTFTSVNLNLR